MNVLILANLLTGAPMVAETIMDEPCQVGAVSQRYQQGAAPAPAPPAPRQDAGRTAVSSRRGIVGEEQGRQPNARRRNGKRIPDAELIGPRGIL